MFMFVTILGRRVVDLRSPVRSALSRSAQCALTKPWPNSMTFVKFACLFEIETHFLKDKTCRRLHFFFGAVCFPLARYTTVSTISIVTKPFHMCKCALPVSFIVSYDL